MANNEVVIIDYGMSNILSVKQGFEEVGAVPIVTSDINIIEKAEKIVLPGVGAFENAMIALHSLSLVEALIKVANQGVPFLGICLGMQMLFEESEEFGLTKGLGLIPGRVEHYPSAQKNGNQIKIPQINWHELIPSSSEVNWKGTLLNNQKLGDAVYFVHSFVAKPTNDNHKLAEYICGGNRISAVILKDNIMGCQFHPEKSGIVGLNILRNFMLL